MSGTDAEYRPGAAESGLPGDNEGKQTLIFEPGAHRPPAWYDLGAPFGAVLMTLAVLGLCGWMVADPRLLTKCCGAVAAAAYIAHVSYYLYHFARSRGLCTRRAVLTDQALEVSCRRWTKRFELEDIVFTMSYSSATNMCIVAATETDYAVVTCSCGYLFAQGGREVLTPFYGMNKRFMALNPRHVNYVRNKRARRQNPFKVPLFVFETQYDSPRAEKLIRQLREEYRFR